MDDYCRTVGTLLDRAQREVVVAMFLMRYTEGGGCPEDFVRKLAELRRRGVSVEVYTEDKNYNRAAIEYLREHNVPVFFTERFLHAKVVKVDNCFVVGSHNWTWNAMHKNLEASVLVCNSDAIEPFLEEVREEAKAN